MSICQEPVESSAPSESATPGGLRPASQAEPLDPAEVLAAWQA